MKNIKALIVAAGRGSRLGNITSKTPKPLVKVNEEPLIKRSIDGNDLDNFNGTIKNAKKLTEQKRYYVSNYGIENYIDIVNGKTDKIIKAPNYDRYTVDEVIKIADKLGVKSFQFRIRGNGYKKRFKNDMIKDIITQQGEA